MRLLVLHHPRATTLEEVESVMARGDDIVKRGGADALVVLPEGWRASYCDSASEYVARDDAAVTK